MVSLLSHLSDEYQIALKKHHKLMKASLEEIDNYCEFNRWLNEIHQFCRKWNEKSVREFRGAQAFAIEVSLLIIICNVSYVFFFRS